MIVSTFGGSGSSGATFRVTFDKDDWAENDTTGYYEQRVREDEMKALYKSYPVVDLELVGPTIEEDAAVVEDYMKIVKMETQEGYLKAYASDTLAADVTVLVNVWK